MVNQAENDWFYRVSSYLVEPLFLYIAEDELILSALSHPM
ncbi:uncharacterized protein METZ01_LOCUS301674 [marine metagenome]|uniref:Uncharacterized protein n=1 Tax=marine metagenome TaxID=408172 RepID=A0A382MJJ2_9ZZZZ